VAVEEAMVHSDSPSNLHWLLSNKPRTTGEAEAQQAGSTTKQPDDISSIKLNLDALG